MSWLFFAFEADFACVEQGRDEGFAVDDLVIVDHVEQLGEPDEAEIDLFVFLGVSVASDKAFGEEDVHAFAEETGAWVVVDERTPLAGGVAGLFGEFAARAIERGFAGIKLASGQLPEELSSGVAILAFDDDPGVFLVFAFAVACIDGEDDDGAIVADDVAVRFATARLKDVVVVDAEERALIGNAGIKDSCGCFGWFLRGGFEGFFRED
uniref:Uncharacterized protein n=1 Tax=mine drainage metagenome TaxID=410659 RepID=E6QM56_9ZZZZ